MIYLFTKNYQEARNVAEAHGYPRGTWAFVDKTLNMFIRGDRDQTLYMCGGWFDRRDIDEAAELALAHGWDVKQQQTPPPFSGDNYVQ